jgi:hypothetical protein
VSIAGEKTDLDAFADVLAGLMKAGKFKFPVHMAQLGVLVKNGCLQQNKLSSLLVLAEVQGLTITKGSYVDIPDGPDIRLLLDSLESLKRQRVRPNLEAVLSTARYLSRRIVNSEEPLPEEKRKSRKELAIILENRSGKLLLSKLIKQVQNPCEPPCSPSRTLYMFSREDPYHYVDPEHGLDIYPDSIWRAFRFCLSKLDQAALKTASLSWAGARLSTALRMQQMGLCLSAGNLCHLLTLASVRGAIVQSGLSNSCESSPFETILASEDSQLWRNMGKHKTLQPPAELAKLIVNMLEENSLGIRLSTLPHLIEPQLLRGPKKDFHGFKRLTNLLKAIPCEVRGQAGCATVYKLTSIYDSEGCQIG